MLRVAFEAACRALLAHRHPFSPKKFTQPQLMACLVLKEFSRLDYRGLAEHLADHPDLCTLIGLKAVPHFTTFQKAAQRLLAAAPGREMFDAVLDRAPEDRVRNAASAWRPSTARAWSRATSAATPRSVRPTGSPAATGLTRISRRSSSWSTARAT